MVLRLSDVKPAINKCNSILKKIRGILNDDLAVRYVGTEISDLIERTEEINGFFGKVCYIFDSSAPLDEIIDVLETGDMESPHRIPETFKKNCSDDFDPELPY